MKTQSDVMPDVFKINKLKRGDVEILLADNIERIDDKYEYDLYTLTIPYRKNLESAIRSNPDVWLAFAKAKQNEVVYTQEQLLQQEITDLQLENIEQGQQITDLELIILEG